MEVKIVNSEEKKNFYEVYTSEGTLYYLEKRLYKKYLKEIKQFKNFSEEFTTLEKKVSLSLVYFLLSKRDYTSKALIAKLLERKVSEETIEFVLKKVESYINDEELIERQIAALLQRGRGRAYILQVLRQKTKYSIYELERFFQQVSYDDELASARRILSFKRYSSDFQGKIKATQFLVRRGFSFEIAREATETH